jgi:hypothetical protein
MVAPVLSSPRPREVMRSEPTPGLVGERLGVEAEGPLPLDPDLR